MPVEALHRTVKAADVAPERLAASSVVSEKDKLGEASRQFEAVLLRQVLGDAQKPVFSSTIVKDSAAASIYRDLITNQLADSISKSGSFGLAKVLEPQLQKQLGTRTKPGATGTPTAVAAAAVQPATAPRREVKGGERMLEMTQPAASTAPRFHSPPKARRPESPTHAAVLMQQFLIHSSPSKSHE